MWASPGDRATTRAGRAETELEQVAEHKRRLYVLASLAGSVVVAISWFAREPDDVMLEVTYPVLGLLLVTFAVAFRRGWLRMWLLEWLLAGVVAAAVLGRLAWHLHLGGPIDDRLLVLTGGHYWAVGALIVGGFVVLDRRRGALLGAGVLVVSIVLVVTGAGPELIGPGRSSQALVYLLRVHAFLVVLLALAAAIATLREALLRALVRAEVLEELASSDQLTDLANRRAARELLEHETRASDRYGRPLSVVMIDIDRFKSINDTHGHATGDDVLRAVASVLREHAREADLVARWGGEEFLIVVPQTTAAQAARLAERCRRTLSDRRPGELAVTATFGVAEYRPGESVDALLDRADRILYEAKDAGRDRVHSERPATTGRYEARR